MKKLLSLLGAVVLTASASSAVVSCSYAPSMSAPLRKETDFYSQISADALKAGVLADQNLNIGGKTNVGIDTTFITNDIASKQMIQTYSNWYNNGQGAKPTETTRITAAFDTVFGKQSSSHDGYDYTIADSYGDLKEANGVKTDTRLAKIINGDTDAKNQLVQPSNKIASTLNVVSGLANVVFKNDFDPSIGQTLISLLTSSTVHDVLADGNTVKANIKDIFKKLDTIFTSNNDAIRNVLDNITQSDIAIADKDSTYQEVLTQQTERVFGDLIYFISGKKYLFNDSEGHNGLDVFTDYVQATNASDSDAKIQALIDKKDIIKAKDNADKYDYSDMLNSVSGIVSFAITLLHYFRQFDKAYPKVNLPTDGNHLFGDVTNDKAIDKVLQEKYVNSDTTDDFWYVPEKEQNDSNHYTKLNLQNLISDLDYYLSPTDGQGYRMLRAFAMLLGNPTEKLNPILGTAIEAIKSFKDPATGKISDLVSKIPVIGGLLSGKVGDLWDWLFGKGTGTGTAQTLVRDITNWFTTDGYDPTASDGATLVKSLVGIIGGIDISSLVNDKDKKVLTIVKGILQYLNSSNGSQFLAHPWSVLYNGSIFASVGRIMQSTASAETDETAANDDHRIGAALIKLNDIRTTLLMPMEELFSTIGAFANKDSFVLPDWLYKANNKTIADLFDYLATGLFTYTENGGTNKEVVHNSSALNDLDKNKYFSFNTNSIANVIKRLLPAKADDDKVTRIFDKDGKTTVASFMPILYTIASWGTTVSDDVTYSVQLAGGTDKIEIVSKTPFKPVDENSKSLGDAEVSVNPQAFEYILGVDDTSSTSNTYFRQGSLLMAISNLYGHWYTGEGTDQKVWSEGDTTDTNGKLVKGINTDANAAESIFNVLSFVAKYANDSVDEITRVQYEKYLDPKYWQVKNVKQQGLDIVDAPNGSIQQLDYDLRFYNPDQGKWFTYHVMMQRTVVKSGNGDNSNQKGFVVKQLMLQD